MAVDAVHAIHSSPVVQNIEAVQNIETENALRNPNPQRHSSTVPQDRVPQDKVPQDKVTISPAAQAKQPEPALDKHHAYGSK
jgi:hypothetical protein